VGNFRDGGVTFLQGVLKRCFHIIIRNINLVCIHLLGHLYVRVQSNRTCDKLYTYKPAVCIPVDVGTIEHDSFKTGIRQNLILLMTISSCLIFAPNLNGYKKINVYKHLS
jgi:hypothetical protein